MKYLKAASIVAGVIWFGIAASVGFWIFAPADNFLGVETSSSGQLNGHLPGSIGKRRYQKLVDVTRLYAEDGATTGSIGATRPVTEFAPVPYLNRELKREGAKWRVRSTDGLDAEIYEIS